MWIPCGPMAGITHVSASQRTATSACSFATAALLVLAASVLLFHLANAAMLPLVGSDVTMRSSRWATALVAACIITPQFVVAAISPTVGQLAQSWGRRPLLLIGFAALPLRGALLAWTNDPYMIVAVQTLDGVSGAVLGILVPLTLADITRGTGRFNLTQGIVGSATGHRGGLEHDRRGVFGRPLRQRDGLCRPGCFGSCSLLFSCWR